LAPILDPIAAGLSKARLTPTVITVLGLLVTLVGAALIAVDSYALGGIIAGVGSTLDALDGPLARYQGTASTRGAFVDTMADRLGEIGLWAGLTFSLRADETGLMLCLLALAFSLLTPYVRSKAESWEPRAVVGGWVERSE
jgi:phosphatidylglycerophosphate synthase